ncbi:MAG: F0F1 ATP synthase subunit A [Bacteroidota bacterium]
MQLHTLKTVFIAFFLTLSTLSFAASSGEKGEDPTEAILHHVNDTHGFHVIGDFSIPLPVILWTENGLVTFMSSEFHHDIDGKVIVEKKGMQFVNYHEKIYQLQPGETIVLDAEEHPTNTRPLDFSITKNVFSMLLSMVFLFLIFITAARSYKKNKGAPKGIAKFIEPLVVFVKDEIAIPNIGKKKYRKYLGFLLTVFFFIWLNNLMGLIPFFPFSANLSGNIAFTVTLATFTFIIVNVNGNKHYWKHIFWMPGIPIPIRIIMAPLEFIGVFTKPISLFIRLFANITAGHIVVLALISLIFFFKNLYGDVAGYAVAPVSIAFVVFVSIIEILVVAIQAYIFTVLSALYIGMATAEDEHH